MKTTEGMSTLAPKETQEQINGLVLAFREEIMDELQMASDFMSQLQARVETLSKSFKEKQEEDKEQELDVRTKIQQLFEKHEELSSKFENLLGQKDSLATEQILLDSNSTLEGKSLRYLLV
ncbi:reticulocyte-binding protein 2 a-like isoform X3 [Biomphalaria pfeifferi]|uniref:Reticulocyte-binding protein 2 a-like isoform X3 n=1 Tax=Biomphalaria pfeifferi TaxID=112525 RepID=A0AAD8B7A0_BIOPF|nr:reticulocyte-binding protein 2 a-like isoform X3 [Biomphalaria pfeifferi]